MGYRKFQKTVSPKAMAESLLKMMKEEGKLLWSSPLQKGFYPINGMTGKEYQGRVNPWILAFMGQKHGCNIWTGKGQMAKAGGWMDVEVLKNGGVDIFVPIKSKYKEIDEKTGKEETRWVTNGKFTVMQVWNKKQLSKQPKWKVEEPKPLEFDGIKELDEFFAKQTWVKVTHGNTSVPCYIPSLNEIRMPEKSEFKSVENYYRTLFHELIHATGHGEQLDRDSLTSTRSRESYSKEELIAEIGAATLCGQFGIDTDKDKLNSAAYVQGWFGRLEDDPTILLEAIRESGKAIEWLFAETVAEREKISGKGGKNKAESKAIAA